MKRMTWLLVAALALLALPGTAQAQSNAEVRVVHASPDAPAVDVLVNGDVAFENAPFTGVTDYAALPAASYGVQVVPTGETEPVVIDAELALNAGTDYTVVAVGQLDSIEPLVLTDNNSAPAEGMAHVRFVHASPNAPAVDIAVRDGPTVFSNVAFKGTGDYTPVDAGTYSFDVRPAGADDVVLEVNDVTLEAGNVYTVFAMGLVGEEPALQAVLSVDAETGGEMSAASEGEDMPEQMPATGGGGMADSGPSWLLLTLAALGATLIASGLAWRRWVMVPAHRE